MTKTRAETIRYETHWPSNLPHQISKCSEVVVIPGSGSKNTNPKPLGLRKRPNPSAPIVNVGKAGGKLAVKLCAPTWILEFSSRQTQV